MVTESTGHTNDKPPRSLLVLAISTRLLTLAFLSTLSHLSPLSFDTSHRLLSPAGTSQNPFEKPPISQISHTAVGLRWDSIHFASIAVDGYQYEQQMAFMPGWPLVMHMSGEVVYHLRSRIGMAVPANVSSSRASYSDVVYGGMAVNFVAGIWATLTLYKLTKSIISSHSFAYTTALLYTLAPTPAILVSPYTEPLYALCAFTGFYYVSQRRWILAAGVLAMATGLRATGLFNVGVLGWAMVFVDTPTEKIRFTKLLRRALWATPLCVLVITPFLAFQYYAYISFCSETSTRRPWCDMTLPTPYSHVQATYWNNGLFKYWTVEQIPNLLLAFPVLLVSLSGTWTYFFDLLVSERAHLQPPPNNTKSSYRDVQSYLAPAPAAPIAALPFHLHHLFLTLLLICTSHTQIALRVAATDPVVWWNVASMAFVHDPTTVRTIRSTSSPSLERTSQTSLSPISTPSTTLAPPPPPTTRMTRWGKIWIWWVVMWGSISIVLWAGHYPPA